MSEHEDKFIAAFRASVPDFLRLEHPAEIKFSEMARNDLPTAEVVAPAKLEPITAETLGWPLDIGWDKEVLCSRCREELIAVRGTDSTTAAQILCALLTHISECPARNEEPS